MRHLSGLDAMFLHVESPEMPMHVGSLNVIKLPEGYAGDYYEDAKAHVAKRMHLADVFTRKLALMPFDLSNPVWVDDEDIDLDYHMRHVTLPLPGSNRQLQQYVARLHSSLLDRSRPLWEFFIIDGLKSGEVALYTKVHHAGIDGQAGAALATAIFDLGPVPRAVKPPRPRVRRNQYQLGMAELAGAALRNTLDQFIKLGKLVPPLARAARDVLVPAKGENGKRDWSALKMPKGMKLFGPRTLFNVSITNQRSFAGRTVPLAEVKQIAKAFGVSLNDVVIATTAGALRRYLKEYDDLPDKPLIAAVPVSLREAGDASANNQVSMITMTLGTDIADPVARMLAIHADSSRSKAVMGRMKAVIPTDFPMFGAPWLFSGIASLLGRSRIVNVIPPIANVLISNVQGAPMPLYFAGAELTSYYPVSIPAHGMALNVTVQSYNGRLDYGLIACRRVVPDITDIGDFIVAEHRKLMELVAAKIAGDTVKQAVSEPKQPVVRVQPSSVATKKVAAAKKTKLKLVAETAKPANVSKASSKAKRKVAA